MHRQHNTAYFQSVSPVYGNYVPNAYRNYQTDLSNRECEPIQKVLHQTRKSVNDINERGETRRLSRASSSFVLNNATQNLRCVQFKESNPYALVKSQKLAFNDILSNRYETKVMATRVILPTQKVIQTQRSMVREEVDLKIENDKSSKDGSTQDTVDLQ